MDAGQKEQIDTALSTLFYRCNLSFSIVESAAFKDFVNTIRPSYSKFLPSRKVLGGTMLDNAYLKYKEIGLHMIKSARMYSLVTDGWSNVRQEHLVNFIVIIPNQKPIFFKAVDTSGVVQSAENIAKQIIDVAEEIGTENSFLLLQIMPLVCKVS